LRAGPSAALHAARYLHEALVNLLTNAREAIVGKAGSG
jgi:hypothetical protein